MRPIGRAGQAAPWRSHEEEEEEEQPSSPRGPKVTVNSRKASSPCGDTGACRWSSPWPSSHFQKGTHCLLPLDRQAVREADGGAHRRGFYSASSLRARARRPSFPPGSPAVTSPSCVRFRGSLSSRLLLIIRSPTCSCLSRGGSEPPRPPAPPSSGGVTHPGPAGGGYGVGDTPLPSPACPPLPDCCGVHTAAPRPPGRCLCCLPVTLVLGSFAPSPAAPVPSGALSTPTGWLHPGTRQLLPCRAWPQGERGDAATKLRFSHLLKRE